MKKTYASFLLLIALVLAPSTLIHAQALSEQVYSKLMQAEAIEPELRSRGEVAVIVKLSVAVDAEGLLNETLKQNQREAIRSAQTSLLAELTDANYSGLKVFETIPYISLQVDLSALEELAASPGVSEIHLDELSAPIMDDTVSMIGATNVWATGYTGSGQTVVVLDTGSDLNHEFIQDKIVDEACFSTTNGTFGTESLCPGGAQSSTAPGSGDDCALSISGCGHGTHVAGTTVGNHDGLYGVAKDASLIPIQVFSKITSPAICGSRPVPCALTFASDQLAALEHVYVNLSDDFNIASVNMSLGGGEYSGPCDYDSRKAIIDNLRSVDIATVIASGNDGFTNAIAAPACISTAVSVGAVDKNDNVAGFSNSSVNLDLLAPGVGINSSVPNNGYAEYNGTSMAAPHVAGAWALMKQLLPGASVGEILTILQSEGTPVTDPKNGITTPRIQLAPFGDPEFLLPPTGLFADLDRITGQVALSWGYDLGDGFGENFCGDAPGWLMSDARMTVEDCFLQVQGNGSDDWASGYHSSQTYTDFTFETKVTRTGGGY